MEGRCHRKFTFTGRKLTRLRNAVFPSRQVSSAAPEPNLSPAVNADPVYPEIPAADAIANLCVPTGSQKMDFIHAILIDLIQKGYLYAVSADDGQRYLATEAGKQYVEQHFEHAVDEALGRILDDN